MVEATVVWFTRREPYKTWEVDKITLTIHKYNLESLHAPENGTNVIDNKTWYNNAL